MADLTDILTPLAERLRNLTVDGQAAKGVYIHNADESDVVRADSWYITVGAQEVGSTVGDAEFYNRVRWREVVTFVCVYAVESTAAHARTRRARATAMQDAAKTNFVTRRILADGVLISEVNPVVTGGVLQLGESEWAASRIEIVTSRWVETGD